MEMECSVQGEEEKGTEFIEVMLNFEWILH
jgi:hypothetical protein